MRLAVLDVGSNSAHLQVGDRHPGGPPLTVFRLKVPTRLAESVDSDGALSPSGVQRLVDAGGRAVAAARAGRVAELIPLPTATVRDATNGPHIRSLIKRTAGIELMSLSGEEEARLTFLAARRWLGFSAGPLLLLDIGGASMEIAYGGDENPELAVSLPLGAGRLTRELLPDHPACGDDVKVVRRHVRSVVGSLSERLEWLLRPHRAVGTSKTFKQLARLTGAPAWRRGMLISRYLRRDDLREWVPRLAAQSVTQRATLPGVSAPRARQLL